MSRPYVVVELDKPRKIRFGYREIYDFEQLTGIKVQELNAKMSFTVKMQLLWIMLRREQPELTFEQTLDLCEEHTDDPEYIIEKVNEALNPNSKNAKTPAAKK
jgi:hypothetical protein